MFHLIALIVLASSPLLFCMENKTLNNKKGYYLSMLTINTIKTFSYGSPLSFSCYYTQYYGKEIVKGYITTEKRHKILNIVKATKIKWNFLLFCHPLSKSPCFFKCEGPNRTLTIKEYLLLNIQNNPNLLAKLKTCNNFTEKRDLL